MYVNKNCKHFSFISFVHNVTSQLYVVFYYRLVLKAHFTNKFHEEYDIGERIDFSVLFLSYDNQHDLPGMKAALTI